MKIRLSRNLDCLKTPGKGEEKARACVIALITTVDLRIDGHTGPGSNCRNASAWSSLMAVFLEHDDAFV